jgi:hypothetical protein
MNFIVAGAILYLVVALAGAAPGQTPSPERSCTDAAFRQFDFWLGEWDVYGPAGQKAGHNVITPVEGGCAIAEHWTSARGGTGTSLNFYDRVDRKWHQAWMDSDGDALRLTGGFADGHMRLRSDSIDGTINRITWTPAPDGTVKQYWDASSDGGRTWKTAFDGKYVKVQAANACGSPEYHQLDFWVGTWEVTSASGEKLGTNRIERILKGCAVQENWSEPDGAEGKSLFYYAPDAKRWNQVWVTDSATDLGGLKEKHSIAADHDGVRFQGELLVAGGKTLLDRTTLKLQPDRRVRQTIETSADGGATWKVQFDGFYSRRP